MPAKRKQMHQANKGVRDSESVCLDSIDATALGELDMPKEMESVVVSVDEERQSMVPQMHNAAPRDFHVHHGIETNPTKKHCGWS